MAENFRFVIIGSGNMAGTYMEASAKVDGAEIVGFVSRSGRRPDAASGELPTASSLDKMRVDFDGVIVCTPNGLHHEGALAAAELDKHVLMEKVLDVSDANMDRMIQVCRDAKVKLGVAFQRRMSPDNRAVKEYLKAGSFGRIYGANLEVMFYRDQAYYDSAAYRGTCDLDGGGPFMQQAAHNIDIYTWFFGMPSQVASLLDTFCHEIEGEDHGIAIMRHPGGMIGSISASTAAAPGYPGKLAVYTEKGSFVLTNDCVSEWHVDGLANPADQSDFAVHSGASSAAVSDTAGHEAIIRDFVEAVKADRDPAVPGESARLATDLILAIYGSQLD